MLYNTIALQIFVNSFVHFLHTVTSSNCLSGKYIYICSLFKN